MLGAPDSTLPDEYQGVAIRIDGGHDVRIVGATIRRYRFGVLAKGTRGLTLDGLDVSDTWKPLGSFLSWRHESLVDWLSFHHQRERRVAPVRRGDLSRERGLGGHQARHRGAGDERPDARPVGSPSASGTTTSRSIPGSGSGSTGRARTTSSTTASTTTSGATLTSSTTAGRTRR